LLGEFRQPRVALCSSMSADLAREIDDVLDRAASVPFFV